MITCCAGVEFVRTNSGKTRQVMWTHYFPFHDNFGRHQIHHSTLQTEERYPFQNFAVHEVVLEMISA